MELVALFFLSALLLSCNAYQRHCNTTWSEAYNGSGTVTFSPGINTAQRPDGSFSNSPESPIPDPTWLVTVQERADAHPSYGLADFWLNTAGVEYWNDTETLFDACAFGINTFFPENTIELSQNDPGDCSVMLTSDCREALMQSAISAVTLLTGNATPPPHSNVSAGRLPHICAEIAAQSFTSFTPSNFPKECWGDYGYNSDDEGPNAWGLALTGPNNSTVNAGASIPTDPIFIGGGLDYSCPIFDSDGETYYSAQIRFSARSYDFAMTQGWPILTVWFQVANEEVVRESDRIIMPTARLSCPRVKTIAKDSTVPSRLPSGHPVSNSVPHPPIHLSSGAIAGIAVGCLVAVLLIIAVVGRYLSKRSGKRRQHRAFHGKPEVLDHEMDDLSRQAMSKENGANS